MPDRTVVLVPRRSNPERDRLWAWARRFWEAQVGLEIFEGWHRKEEGPFNRSAALNRAAAAAGDWDVAVIIDADVVVAPRMVEGAIARAVRTGGPVLAYTERHHLTPLGTNEVLQRDPAGVNMAAAPGAWRRWTRGRMRGSCSSCHAVTRDLWEAVGGFDEGFSGWGYEDIAFTVATETLSGQGLFKIPGILFHLWHAVSAENQPAAPTVVANKARCDRYIAARGDAAAMQRVVPALVGVGAGGTMTPLAPEPPEPGFAYWGVELAYCRDTYNHSGENERTVEIPIARWFVGDRQGEGLEVGNVLAHYGPIGHRVIDRYEAGAGIIRQDVLRYRRPADWVVSVSTLEHVRWDEAQRHPDGSVQALEHLHGLLRPGGRMLVTVPMGWQPFLDAAILDGRLPVKPERQCTLVRDGDGWRQTEHLCHLRYAASTIWAESVWVGEFSA